MAVDAVRAAVEPLVPTPGPVPIRLAWGDGGYSGKLVGWARTRLRLMAAFVKRSDTAVSAAPTLDCRTHAVPAWIARHRHCIRGYERSRSHGPLDH
ncbi:hypothetical protein GCM10022224_016930 [Nonomuraea antimicrobica]|uniref:Transposase n=1 Tax=Nonomuraea antimicrobica TaxID=561173 RepID=A0ABP7BAC0_9ACTN